MRRAILMSATTGAVIALLAAGCGGNSKPATAAGSPTTTAGSPTTTAASGTTVAVQTSKLGKILVDDRGRTLYLFEKDKGPMSTCSGACATAWPPVITTGAPQAGSGASAAELATTARDDGMMQVVYHGHPLYRYTGDSKAGDTTGQGLNQFGAEWFVLAPSGDKIGEKKDTD
jgi:predicted lipoprotein with Yx(FWY)xxD motif